MHLKVVYWKIGKEAHTVMSAAASHPRSRSIVIHRKSLVFIMAGHLSGVMNIAEVVTRSAYYNASYSNYPYITCV